MIDETAPASVDGGAHAAAAVMPDDQYMLYLQHVDGELQDRQVVAVLRRREIGDVAVDEKLARVEADNLVGRYTAVGAADPEIGRRLLAFEPLKESSIGRDLSSIRSPGTIVAMPGG